MRFGLIEQRLAHALDQTGLSLNAALQLTEIIERDLVRLDRIVDREVVILLHRAVDLDVDLQLRFAHARRFVVVDFFRVRAEHDDESAEEAQRGHQHDETYSLGHPNGSDSTGKLCEQVTCA